ncbi:MAG: Gfo/Idh/MocA family oxidoreductase, partial [Archaeoglobaceae archaeon]
MRVAVIGVGNMGYHHARIYSEFAKEGKVELVGVSDVNAYRAKEVAEKFGTRAFKDYRELLGFVDAVSIAVPTPLHYEVAMDFIKAGVHVLVEKPIADSVEKAEEMIREAEKNGVVLMVGHVERFNPAVLKLKELISAGELGEVITMSAKRVGPFDGRNSNVNVIIDLAVHDIDIMGFLLNSKVCYVYSKARRILGETEDYALITLRFENNTDGIVETNRLTPYKLRLLNTVGSKGVAELYYIHQKLCVYKDNIVKEVEIAKREPLKVE